MDSVFVDTSGWYALLDRKDSAHVAAREQFSRLVREKRRLVTSDYVIAETATLTKARAGGPASCRLFDLLDRTMALQVEWIGPARFDAATRFFRKHHDHGYSFTDCTSFLLMKELGAGSSLTTDAHFQEAGFAALLRVAV